jgi:hypothetical protein
VSIFDRTTGSIKPMVVDLALFIIAAFTLSLLVYGFIYTVSDIKRR